MIIDLEFQTSTFYPDEFSIRECETPSYTVSRTVFGTQELAEAIANMVEGNYDN